MKKYKTSDSKILFSYPSNWTVEENEYTTTFYNAEKALGALQFSFYKIDEKIINPNKELKEYLEDKNINDPVNTGNEIASAESIENNRFWKYWFIKKKDELLFATYNCLVEDAGKEDQEVNLIINFIQ